MDYERLYKEALERARQIHNQTEFDYEKGMMEEIFPELAESENEKIRKGILELVKQSSEILEKKNQERMIAWLEKQNSPVLSNSSNIGKSEKCSADKVEPKFKVRGWIINGGANPCYVKSIFGDYYELCSCEGFEYTKPIIDVNYTYHLWTIADAKDGDILQLGEVTAIFQKYIGNSICECYCSICDGEFEIPSQDGADNSYGCHNAIPATKEQRNLLFQKMKEAGYEWDAERKELQHITIKQ